MQLYQNMPRVGLREHLLIKPIMKEPANTQAHDPIKSSANLLHKACQLFPTDITTVGSALVLDPNSIRQRCTFHSINDASIQNRRRYSLPINIALKNHATLRVLDLLIKADPSVLVLEDGIDCSASLIIALRNARKISIFAVVELILGANPDCIRTTDRNLNSPLHVACFVGVPLNVVKVLCSFYPDAASMKNKNGETPLSIAQRSIRCPENVVDFLFDYSGRQNFCGTL